MIHRCYKDFKPLVVTPADGSDPWVDCSAYISQGDKIICEVSMTTCKNPGWPCVSNLQEMIDNAYLIKEAPNLLSALEDCIEYVKNHAPREWVEELKQVVARAKGEITLEEV
jgi:hypothetical protein